jgi:hypothetical protein
MAVIDLEHVTRLADLLSPEEKQSLIEHLTRQVQEPGGGPPPEAAQTEKQTDSLRGIWEGQFPEDFDIDAALNEIRHEWEKELDEVSGE